MQELTKHNVIHLAFLELVSLAPLFIILGNIAPPIPIKVHHIGLGLIFLVALFALFHDGYKKWMIYFAGVFTLIQFTFEQWYLKGLIDYFFGPFVLLLLVDIVVNHKLPRATLQKYVNRFLTLLWIPIVIAIFQYFSIIPITFWKATYINYAYFGSLAIPRPNGLLYHGSELSVIICFMALFQFFKKGKMAVLFLQILVCAAFMTYFKALTASIVLLFVFYLAFVNRGFWSQIQLFSRRTIVAYTVLLVAILGAVAVRFFMQVHDYTGYYFPPAMLTGRGAIWNIYLERIKEFTAWNYLFGNGMGTSFDIFADYATPKTWYLLAADPKADTNYDTHNAILSVFINSGLVGMAFIGYLFRIVFNQVKKWNPSAKWNKTVFFGIFILPLFTIGITIPIYENAIFGLRLGFYFVGGNFMQMMKQQIKTKVLTLPNIDFLLLAALLISFFLHYRINGFMVMLVLIFALVKLALKQNLVNGSVGLLFFPALFFTLLIGQVYTENLKEGWTLIERNISVLALPFAVKGIVDFSPIQRRILTHIFIASAAVTGLICLLIAAVNALQTGSIYVIPNNTHFLYNTFMHQRLTSPLALHAVYFALFVALANAVVLYRIITSKKELLQRVGLILLFIFFTGLLYLLKSANIAFGFSLVSLLILLDSYGRSIFRSRIKFSAAVFVLLILSVFTVRTVQTKLENFSFTHNMADEQMSALGIRLSIWECTWQVIQENWVLGTGTGDSQDELVKKYQANHFTIGYRDDFNAHNMYLQYWMSNGLPMLMLFVGVLVMLLRRAYKNRNTLFLGFVLLFALFSFTESTMRTQKGMVFFVLFAALFYWYPKWMVEKSDQA